MRSRGASVLQECERSVFDRVAHFYFSKAHALGVKLAGVEAHLSEKESDLQAGASHISK